MTLDDLQERDDWEREQERRMEEVREFSSALADGLRQMNDAQAEAARLLSKPNLRLDAAIAHARRRRRRENLAMAAFIVITVAWAFGLTYALLRLTGEV